MSKKRICVVHRYPLDEAVATNPSLTILLTYLASHKWDVSYLSYAPSRNSMQGVVGRSVLGIKYDRTKRLEILFKSVLFVVLAPFCLFLMNLVGRIDLIYCDDALPGYYYLAKVLTGSKVVYRMGDHMIGYLLATSSPAKKTLFKILSTVEARMLDRIDRVLAISDVLKQYLTRNGVSSERVHVVTECVDTIFFDRSKLSCSGTVRARHEIAEEEILLMTHGILVPWKDTGTLIKAVSILQRIKEKLKFKLMIIGDGPSLVELKSLAEHLGVVDRVVFIGWVPYQRIPDYIVSCDLGITTRSRIMANDFVVTTTLLQYLASAKPVLAPKLRAISELVKNEALLYEPGNPEDLANKLMSAIEDLAAMRLFSEKLSAQVKQKYDIRKVSKELIKEVFSVADSSIVIA